MKLPTLFLLEDTTAYQFEYWMDGQGYLTMDRAQIPITYHDDERPHYIKHIQPDWRRDQTLLLFGTENKVVAFKFHLEAHYPDLLIHLHSIHADIADYYAVLCWEINQAFGMEVIEEQEFTLSDEATTDGILTDKQKEVLQHVANGLTDKEIAATMNISDSTVGKHVDESVRKLGAKTRTHAVVLAFQRSLIKFTDS